jgi:interferon, gamma-inducible protein 30
VQVKVLPENQEAIKKCYTSALGNELEHIMAVQTYELDPAHEYVPWVVANGEHTDEDQDFISQSLLGYVCETYKGDNKAAICTQLSEMFTYEKPEFSPRVCPRDTAIFLQ